MANEVTEPTTDANGKRASHRLRDMLTTAVGVVDRAANDERFLIVKAKDGGMTTKADDDQDDGDDGDDGGGLRLPADVKQSLTDGIADTLEKLSAIAQQLQDCQVDESAECPPELSFQIDEIADDLDDLADEFAPKASPADMKAKGAARKTNATAKAKFSSFERTADGAYKAKKPFPGAAPPFGKDDDASEDAGQIAKGPNPDVSRDPPGEGPGGATAPAQNGPGDTDNPDVMMKSGRKMAKDRLEKLVMGHKAHGEAMDHLTKAVALMKSGSGSVESVLKEVYDGPGFMQPPGPAPTDQPVSGKPAPAEPEVSPRAAAPDVTGMAKAAAASAAREVVDEITRGPLASLTAAMADLRTLQKSIGDRETLDALRGNARTPRSNPNEGNGAVGSAKPKQSWPADMSAELKKRRTLDAPPAK